MGEKELPERWQIFSARAILGACLAAQEKYRDAESLLTSGYEGMKQHEKDIPAEYLDRLTEAAESLINLYEATSQSAQALEWRQKVIPLK